jgi:hypothetical protein
MPFIQKKCIWWEPVPGASGYVVYVRPDCQPINSAEFSWGETSELLSRVISGETNEIVIPDEWPEFPKRRGTYHIAVTAEDDDGNQSDPLLLSAIFNLTAPQKPVKGGIDVFPRNGEEPEIAGESPMASQTWSMIERGLKEVKNNQELTNAYLGKRPSPGEKEIL